MDSDKNLIVASPDNRLKIEYDQLLQKVGRCYFTSLESEVRQIIAEQEINAILVDMYPNIRYGTALVSKLATNTPYIPTVAITKNPDYQVSVSSIRAGAKDIICEPLDQEKISDTLQWLTKQPASWMQTRPSIESLFVHDIRNLLQGIEGLLCRLDTETISHENKENLQALLDKLNGLSKKSTTLLERTVNIMESCSRHKQLTCSVVSLHTLTKNIYKEMETQLTEKLIDAKNAVPSDCIVFANPFMTEFVIHNLLHNAWKFSKKSGKIEVYAFNHEDRVYVTISDNGVGMDETTMQALNNNMFIESTKGTNNEPGNGYGLKISRHFIRQHGSDLQIISVKNKGSCTYFSLPAYIFSKHNHDIQVR